MREEKRSPGAAPCTIFFIIEAPVSATHIYAERESMLIKIKSEDQNPVKKFYINVPDKVLTPDEKYLLKCCAEGGGLFANYCDYREYSLVSTIASMLCTRYYIDYASRKRPAVFVGGKQTPAPIYATLRPDIVNDAIGFDGDDGDYIREVIMWCQFREKELAERGWTWGCKFTGVASERFTLSGEWKSATHRLLNWSSPCRNKMDQQSDEEDSSDDDGGDGDGGQGDGVPSGGQEPSLACHNGGSASGGGDSDDKPAKIPRCALE